jgi:hypothetical protein
LFSLCLAVGLAAWPIAASAAEEDPPPELPGDRGDAHEESAPPHHHGGMHPIRMATLVIAAGEILIPDLRWERDERSGLLVTWPVIGTFLAGQRLGLGVGFEPQYSVRKRAWRGAGFAQAALFFNKNGGLGLYNQTGYLVGQDGDGPFTSLGIALGSAYAFHWGLFSRVGTYDGNVRVEAGIDVQVQWLWVLLRG